MRSFGLLVLLRLECDLGQGHPTIDVGTLQCEICGYMKTDIFLQIADPFQEGHCWIIWVGLHALNAWSHVRDSTAPINSSESRGDGSNDMATRKGTTQ